MSNLSVRLFAADPLSIDGREPRLQLDKEVERIEHEVLLATHRDRVDFKSCWATSIEAMGRELNRAEPQVVHFSGHGGSGGIVLVSEDSGEPHRVGADALESFFKAHRGRIKLVILNACHSQPEAAAIARAVGCAIGVPKPISDRAAIKFSAAFYSAITFGHSVQTAFNQACATLEASDFHEGEWPVLEATDGVDPSTLILIPPDPPSSAVPEPIKLLETAPPASPVPPVRRRRRARAMIVLSSVLLLGAAIFIDPPWILDPRCGPARDAHRSAVASFAASLQIDPGDELAEAKKLHAAGSFARAFELFKPAAIAGNEEAMSYVGLAYLRGEGVAVNADSAIKWLDHARDTDDPRGMSGIGQAYLRGSAPRREYLAHLWTEKAALAGFPEAIRDLGAMHRDGVYVPVDRARALDLFEKAARAGFVDALADVGGMYEHDEEPARDPRTAWCWYRAAAGAGSERGMYELARTYQEGMGVRRSLRTARGWYHRAALAGHADAMNTLGMLYENGLGVRKNLEVAIGWYRRAAEAGSVLAQERLASLQPG